MLQSVVSVSIRSPECDHPDHVVDDDDDDGDHLRVGAALQAHLGNRDRRVTTNNCPFPPGECSRCGSRSRSASPRSVGDLASREASPFTYTTRIVHRRRTPNRRRRHRTSTKVRKTKKNRLRVLNIQGWAKEWSLGCVNSRPVARGSQEAGFTQPRDHSFSQRCTNHQKCAICPLLLAPIVIS